MKVMGVLLIDQEKNFVRFIQNMMRGWFQSELSKANIETNRSKVN